MLTEERFQRILSLVEEQKSVSVQNLMEELDISESTARRDLTELDAQGKLIKVRGGAMAKNSKYKTKDDMVSLRKAQNQDEKRRIAKYAASLIEPNDFIYLDAGTTTELMIDYLTEKNVVFVTNAVSHAKRLSEAGYITYILGGEFKATTEAIVGDEAVESLAKYNFTKGFWGTNGVDSEAGFSTPDVKEAMIKKVSMNHSEKRYVLCDSSKFSQISCVKFGDFTNAVIITTKVGDKEYAHCENIVEVKEQ
ncbi:MAG: DeoR/GlpR transcriptional regulator [Lachnospiraceae bacterium]|mgnify:CR=1 FL=1|nr:DeoR/GlpR transcriptional regulator [Lachnospiraceae bacterium]